jgi:hypothetical protein
MKYQEFYVKYKTSHPPVTVSLFTKRNWWRIVLITIAAVLIEPLVIMHKHQRSFPFSFNDYLELAIYFLLIVVPFVAFLFWVNWREATKRRRGYGWVGKFEVIKKRSLFVFHYLLLSPGTKNRIKVNQRLFDRTKVGDFVEVRRDIFGGIEAVSKIKNFSSRLSPKLVKSHSQ